MVIKANYPSDHERSKRTVEAHKQYGTIPHMPFEEYSERLKHCFIMKRKNGILEARLHTNGGSVEWGAPEHQGLHYFFDWAGRDPENEVIIFGGTGKDFFKGIGKTNTKGEWQPATEFTSHPDESWKMYDFQFYDGIQIAKCWTEVTNTGSFPIGLEYLSSFSLSCIAKEGAKGWQDTCALHVPHNTWYGECRWVRSSLPELGMYPVTKGNFPVTPGTMKRVSYSVNGTWSCNDFLPMGIFENAEMGTMLFWQIEHNGSWQWEIGGCGDDLCLKISGPNENENHWWKNLAPKKLTDAGRKTNAGNQNSFLVEASGQPPLGARKDAGSRRWREGSTPSRW